jgi:hypothetical protein
MDVYRHILVVDTSVLATSNMNREGVLDFAFSIRVLEPLGLLPNSNDKPKP